MERPAPCAAWRITTIPPLLDAPTPIHEDEDLLVMAKPSGVATTAPSRSESFTERLESLRSERLHASSRLDREVSGIVTFARTKRGIAALDALRERGAYHRLYLALVGADLPAEGVWDGPIEVDPKDRRLRRVALGNHGRAARTRFARHARAGGHTLLRLTPETGRTHQLRVHAAHAGAPILGDARYGGLKRVSDADGRVVRATRVMLHCATVTLEGMGAAGAALVLRAPIPDDLRAVHLALGGDGADLTRAGGRPNDAAPDGG